VQGLTWSIVADGLTRCQTYSDQPAFHAIALIGSHGWVEIAINGGNAQSQLQLDWGARVELMCTQTKEVNAAAASELAVYQGQFGNFQLRRAIARVCSSTAPLMVAALSFAIYSAIC